VLGVSPRRALLWELPKMVLWRVYNRFASITYAFVDTHRLVDEKISSGLALLTEGDCVYFYVIVMPRMLHLLIPAIRLIAPYAKIIFILNGSSSLEEQILKKEFPDIPALRLSTVPRSPWPHGRILNLLIRNSSKDFGIIDHDFFLCEPAAIEQLEFQGREFAICAATWRNQATGIEFPGTHFLYLRVSVLRATMHKHGVGAQLYKRIPRTLTALLHEMGLSLNNPPKEYQSFFDSFMLLSALAIYDGFEVRRLTSNSGDWEHIGGTSIGLTITKNATHHYVSNRFINLLAEKRLVDEYRRAHMLTRDDTAALRGAVNPRTSERIDTLVERLAHIA
jgi:hypothetical protein